MKKPKISFSKKGAMINILWILVENPNNRYRLRICDIKNDLLSEFGIELNEKTVKDYVDILQDLNFLVKISHDTNKGYYVSERMLDDNERRILFDLIKNSSNLSEETKKKLLLYSSFELSSNERKNRFSGD